MNKVKQMLESLEKELRKEKNYSAANKLLPIIEEARKWSLTLCSDHNPEKSGDYLVLHAPGHYQVVSYSKRYDAWNAWDDFYNAENEMKDIVAWMELPEDYVSPEPEVIQHEN